MGVSPRFITKSYSEKAREGLGWESLPDSSLSLTVKKLGKAWDGSLSQIHHLQGWKLLVQSAHNNTSIYVCMAYMYNIMNYVLLPHCMQAIYFDGPSFGIVRKNHEAKYIIQCMQHNYNDISFEPVSQYRIELTQRFPNHSEPHLVDVSRISCS